MTHTPIGIRSVLESLKKAGDEKEAILDRAILERQALLATYRASRARLGWHPFQTIKSIFISCLLTFSIAWLISTIAVFGKWYMDLRANKIAIPIPFLGSQKVDLGSVIPVAPGADKVALIPSFGVREVSYFAMGIVAIIVVERVVLTMFNLKQIRILKKAESEIEKELEALHSYH